MTIKDLLKLLYNLSLSINNGKIFLVGGLPRDRVLGITEKTFEDIDLTTGDTSVKQLAVSFAEELKKYFPIVSKQALDGHVSIFLPNFKFDFSSNFIVPDIDNILYKKGILHPTEMQREIYSRDFFCNTLLMSLDLKRIKDLTHQALDDIHHKIIRTCLSPDLTFMYNPNRLIRSVYLSAKLDFDVDPLAVQWIKKNPQYLTKCESKYLAKNIDKALLYNPDRTIYLLNKMNIWNYIPITQALYPYFAKKAISEEIK